MKSEIFYIILVILTGCVIGLGIHTTKSYFESKTYNKLTGAHTTTWDAMWVELRVQDAPKKSNE